MSKIPSSPVLSVITPTFNSCRHIEKCLRHVQSEWVEGVEHVIIDGASDDGTAEVVSEFAKTHPYVKWISERDTGQSAAMNKGLEMASGKFVCFLNVDDFFVPKALAFVIDRLSSLPTNTFLLGNCNILNDSGKLLSIRKPRNCGYPQILKFWKLDIFPPNPTSYFYPKSFHSLVGPYDETEHYVLDYEMFVRILHVGKPYYIDRTLGNFVLHQDAKTFRNSAAASSPPKLHVYMKYIKDISLPRKWSYEIQRVYHTRLRRSNNRLIFFAIRPRYALKYAVRRWLWKT